MSEINILKTRDYSTLKNNQMKSHTLNVRTQCATVTVDSIRRLKNKYYQC